MALDRRRHFSSSDWRACLAGRIVSATCDSLARLTLDNTKITVAQEVAPGGFRPPGPARQGGAATQRAFATLRHSAGSRRHSRRRATRTSRSKSGCLREMEWKVPGGGQRRLGRHYLLHGDAGGRVGAGYATASTDTGHVGGTGAFALGHPEKVTDFGYRAVHEMTVKAKAVIDAFYGTRAHARDLEWLLTGRPAGHRRGRSLSLGLRCDRRRRAGGELVAPPFGRLAINRAVNATPANVIPSSRNAPVIHRAALAACDARDGVTEDVIENPGACTFDPRRCRARGGRTRRASRRRRSSPRGMIRGRSHPVTRASVRPVLPADQSWAGASSAARSRLSLPRPTSS